MKKVYVLVRGIGEDIIRRSLKRDVKFLKAIDIMTESKDDFQKIVAGADEETYFIVPDRGYIPFLERYNVCINRIVPFFSARLFMFPHGFDVIKKRNWILCICNTLYNTLLRKSNGSNDVCIIRIVEQDIRLIKKHHQQKKIAIVGYNKFAQKYIDAFVGTDVIWGIIDDGVSDIAEANLSNIRKLEELFYENLDHMWYYVANKAQLRKVEGLLIEIGVNRNRIFGIGRSEEFVSYGSKMTDSIDPLLGFSRIEDEVPGFHVFRGEKEAKYRILTLGGSTSDPYQVNIKSWPEYLFEQLSGMGIDVEIYAGGVSAYTVAQELLKLMRDGMTLKPDIVISYSGINDATTMPDLNCKDHPFIRPYMPAMFQYLIQKNRVASEIFDVSPQKLSLGVCDKSKRSDFWIKCQCMMKSVCEGFAIDFYGYLQPWNTKNGINIPSVREEVIQNFYDEVRKSIRDNGGSMNWIRNLDNIFDGKDNIYYDICHVYERGNRIIAQAILPDVLSSIGRIRRRTE